MKKWIFGEAVVLIIIVVVAFFRNGNFNPKTENSRLENELELSDSQYTQNNLKQKNEIPQGTFTYTLYFSEFASRSADEACIVTIKGNHILVEKPANSKLPGSKIIIEGELKKHKSGKWIISRNPEDVNADEIGGCSDGPTPIYFETKIIEWC